MIDIIDYELTKQNQEFENYINSKKVYLLYSNDFINNLIKTYKVKFYFIVSFNSKKKINGLLFFYTNKNFGNKINAFTFYDCFITDDEKITSDIVAKIEEFINEFKISSFTINTNKKINSLKFNIKTNYILNIAEGNIENNWNNKPGVFRTEVRKAIKRNFIVKKERLFPISEYYKLYLNNQLKKKIPIHDKIFFTNLFEIKSNYVFSCIKDNNLAGYALISIYNNNAHLLFSNISNKQVSHGVNQLIFWEIIKYLSEISCKTLILGPSKKDGRTAFFKKKIGGEEVFFNEYKKLKSKLNSDTKLNKESNIFKKLIIFLLNKLPKSLLEIIYKKKRYYGKVF